MHGKGEKMEQLKIRLPATARKAIEAAAHEEGKALGDYIRTAALLATCHTRRKATPIVFIAPREGVSLERARALGMAPMVEVGGEWSGEVRVSIGKNGLFQDKGGGVWMLTPQGLKQVMGFDDDTLPQPQRRTLRRAKRSAVAGGMPATLNSVALQTALGLRPGELREVAQWGLGPRREELDVRTDDFEAWLDLCTRYPGIFLTENFAAALMGLSVVEFRRRSDVFDSARASFNEQLFWKHRLDAIYRARLDVSTAYGSLRESHEAFAERLGVRPAPCVVCGEHRVHTVCHQCHQLVDPAHCEAVRDDRPLPFRPAEVCFNCIRDQGLSTFDFFRDRRSVRASVERELGKRKRR
jgi:hypothetical protein